MTWRHNDDVMSCSRDESHRLRRSWMYKMVNVSRYYRALESVSISSALSIALLLFTHARSESINADSLNSNFIQLGRRSGGRPQRTVHPRRLPVNTVIHTTLAGFESTTFRLLVRRATSSATFAKVTVKIKVAQFLFDSQCNNKSSTYASVMFATNHTEQVGRPHTSWVDPFHKKNKTKYLPQLQTITDPDYMHA